MAQRNKDFDRLPDDARLSVADAANLLAKSKATVFRLLAIGAIPPTRSVPAGTRPTLRLGDVRQLLRGEQ